ncbi:MAG: hypothetical protein WBC40_05095 [Halobacteriota archaeon]
MLISVLRASYGFAKLFRNKSTNNYKAGNRIYLTILRLRDPDIEEKLPDYGTSIRVLGLIKFKTRNGWSETESAILDSGAPISVIPFDIWQNAETEILTNYELTGIVPRRECKLPVLIGRIRCILLDKLGNMSKEMRFRAFLALTNQVPLVLGFKDLLENFNVCFDCKKDRSFIQE